MFYERINTFSVVCFYHGDVGTGRRGGGRRGRLGGGARSKMKLVDMCRLVFKNGRLRERPLNENEGLSERPLTGKTGDFGAENNKETFIF